MIKRIYIQLVAISLLSTLLAACKDDPETKHFSSDDYTVLVVNQGNFSESNGSLSCINGDGTVTNHVYKTANGYPLASIIESVVDCGPYWALLCNNEDKVEIVDKKSFRSVATVKNILTPRYGVVKDSLLFVTSADLYHVSESHVYSIDLKRMRLKDTIAIEGTPEGIVVHDDCLWVAISTDYDAATYSNKNAGVVRLQLQKEFMQNVYLRENVNLDGRHLVVDGEGNVWLSMSGYGDVGLVAKVDTVSKTLIDDIELNNLYYPGHIFISKTGNGIYYMATDGYSTGSADEKTEIKMVDLSSKSCCTLATGRGFYGFGVDASTGDIYTANVCGFVTNSVMYIYDKNGNLRNQGDLVGVGACRFIKR